LFTVGKTPPLAFPVDVVADLQQALLKAEHLSAQAVMKGHGHARSLHGVPSSAQPGRKG
jgi:hypothetical protein